MSNKEHTLLCIMGETACGKDSLVEKLCERMGTKQLISYTTRNRRVGEGDTHCFVDEEDFNQMKAEGQIAAYTEMNRNSDFTNSIPFANYMLPDLSCYHLLLSVPIKLN